MDGCGLGIEPLSKTDLKRIKKKKDTLKRLKYKKRDEAKAKIPGKVDRANRKSKAVNYTSKIRRAMSRRRDMPSSNKGKPFYS